MGERRCAPKGRAPRCGRCANGKHGFSGSYFTAHVALYAPSRNELPGFSSNIAAARVADSFKLAPTGVLLKKAGVYSAKRNTATEIGKFLSKQKLCSPSETVRIMKVSPSWPHEPYPRASIKRDERADAGPYRDILLVTSFSIPLRTTSATSATAAHRTVPSTIL